MLEHLRGYWTKLITPVAKMLMKLGITPDMTTWVGAAVSIATSLIFFPNGWLWQGALVVTVFVLADSLDGTMARLTNQASKWGAFLDSTLDRITDGFVFGSLAIYYASTGEDLTWFAIGIFALIFGQVTSYSKARGESLGYEVKGGLAGRADRLLIGMLGAFLTGIGVEWALPAAFVVLLVLGIITVGQRMWIVKRAYNAEASGRNGQ
ncbi:CDP-alcohol phosphatidyltransferase family protein [Propionimicrobium lymphophilum]|uniref:phosphatidylinositol phosphate synthase n=1 Tax=Propionimicrobium TaxID=203133 RepID=UPI0003D7990C|nr:MULTISPECIES: CDP-alcohol phosphatidyltransferase family protein [Propionimicrobium]ETJ96866.1 CDP-alcohol phosphatidyltransferase [Propionimicrobium sp. BV2F7]MDK7709600.1 CDP-alcohol phosphatidyltransferase family protein [Propionimicrobium lymphophilum]MDK7733585.1 CDP-alcohol phosphatidyltransferase family protein [Propionimicrobium lymphophilum]